MLKLIKLKSREQLRGNWLKLGVLTLVALVIVGIIQQQLVNSGLIGELLAMIVGIVFLVHCEIFYLRLAKKGSNPGWKDVKITKMSIFKIIGISLIISINTVLISSIGVVILAMSLNEVIVLVGSVFLVISLGILELYLFPLTYLIVENENEPMIKLFKMSVQMMQGNIWRLIKLNFSFLAWISLAPLVLIGYIFWTEHSYFQTNVSLVIPVFSIILIQFIILGYFIPYGLTVLANFYVIVKEEYKLELAEKTREA
ncbi:MAG: DUF975 family protein [Culicoidibacterales bacterium]